MRTVIPRVSISVPSGDSLSADFAMSLATLMYVTKAQVALTNSRSSIIATGRNILVNEAQRVGSTHMLFLDSDMVFPSDTLDRLLSHKKDIVGCVYSRRVAPFATIGTPVGGISVNVTSGLHEMDMLPTGCLLIKMAVYEKMKKPYFRGRVDEDRELIVGEDIEFCEKARALGYRIWCDVELSGKVGHVGSKIYFPEENK